jgi:hypothetical protein
MRLFLLVLAAVSLLACTAPRPVEVCKKVPAAFIVHPDGTVDTVGYITYKTFYCRVDTTKVR